MKFIRLAVILNVVFAINCFAVNIPANEVSTDGSNVNIQGNNCLVYAGPKVGWAMIRRKCAEIDAMIDEATQEGPDHVLSFAFEPVAHQKRKVAYPNYKEYSIKLIKRTQKKK